LFLSSFFFLGSAFGCLGTLGFLTNLAQIVEAKSGIGEEYRAGNQCTNAKGQGTKTSATSTKLFSIRVGYVFIEIQALYNSTMQCITLVIRDDVS
jgi:hypothetical protein